VLDNGLKAWGRGFTGGTWDTALVVIADCGAS